MMVSTGNDDPRLARIGLPGVCGVTEQKGRFEWVCIADVHDTDEYRSRRLSGFGYHPKSERHYMVRRWPSSDH